MKKGTRKCGDCRKYFDEEDMRVFRGGISKQIWYSCEGCYQKRKAIK